MSTLRFKTNLNCGQCVATAKPFLDREPSIASWSVDTSVPSKTLTVEGDNISVQAVAAAVAASGFKVIEPIADTPPPKSAVVEEIGPKPSYYPLIIVVAFLVGVVGLAEIAAGSFDAARAMRHFMGGFFLGFSFFKFLDLRGFAMSYAMYDVVARRIPAYGFVYPFIELALGAAHIVDFMPTLTNTVTAVVMGISSIGVIQSLLAKRTIRCACLGAVFNLPMSTVTLVEDLLMVIMAIAMLLGAPHGTAAAESTAQPHVALRQVSQPSEPAPHESHAVHADHDAEPAGLHLNVESTGMLEPGKPVELRLAVHDASGKQVSRFETVHEYPMHLAIVRKGLDTFAHLHPEILPDGRARVSYTFPAAGEYRLFVDVQPAGMDATSAAARVIVGRNPQAAPTLVANAPGRVSADGVQAQITLDNPDTDAPMIRFELFDAGGRPLESLQPYLGARGHLQLVSADAEQYVHTHPLDAEPGDAPNVAVFHAEFPSAGIYKGWGQFQVDGKLRIVPFVIDRASRAKPDTPHKHE